MTTYRKLICCLLPLVVLAGCKRSESTQEASAPKAAPSPSAVPSTAVTSAGTPAASNADAGSSAETSAKMAAAAWAIKRDEIKNDPIGQWAIQASAASTYNDTQGTAPGSANQMTGPPNVDHYGDNGDAWTSKTPDGGIEWADLRFPKPVHANEVRIRESCGSGAIIKVEVYHGQAAPHVVWQGNDPTTELNYLMLKFPRTSFKTDRVKITLPPTSSPDGVRSMRSNSWAQSRSCQ
jgi:hypothetical protein